jgi:two-component system CheB/CheR fusion protein
MDKKEKTIAIDMNEVRESKSKAKAKLGNFPIIGVGASAGGLEAFVQLISNAPIDSGMAFVLVQHLDPSHPSLSTDILSRSTSMKVQEVQNGIAVLANNIYVIPPNYNMELCSGHLNLLPRPESAEKHLTIDYFFHSLAQAQGSRAIGVVLSGTGSDGTQGLKEIQAKGGITCAQQPATAKYDGMPKHAIAAGVADLILSPETIVKELAEVVTHNYTISDKAQNSVEIESPDLDTSHTNSPDRETLFKIFKLVRAQTNVDFTYYKFATINRRIERRMMVQKIKSLELYAEYLREHPAEVIALYDDILINVTEFFRDPDAFFVLRELVFPHLIRNKSENDPIRIWIPGCSTGEEVYSIAIALMEFLEKKKILLSIQIFATDISQHCIQRARAGIYADGILKNVSKIRLEKYFERVNDEYRIKLAVRDCCLFSNHDMTRDPPFAKLDFVSCRNVLIYFSAVLQKRVLPIFHYALNVDGFLWLGNSETPGRFSSLFNLIDGKNKIYSKANVPTPMNFHFPTNSPPISRSTVVSQQSIKANTAYSNQGAHSDYQRDVDRILLSKFAPPSVIVDVNMEILQFRGRCGFYLEPPTGKPSNNLFKMARPELLASLRLLTQSAITENKSIRRVGLHLVHLEDVHAKYSDVEGIKAEESGTRTREGVLSGMRSEPGVKRTTVNLEVLPINPIAPPSERTYLIIFENAAEPELPAFDRNTASQSEVELRDQHIMRQQITELLNEISDTKNSQQSFIEQYEFTRDQLTTSNEELQSAVEELQSTNEELETAKEELQSTNEELVTVNDELRTRNVDLTSVGNDLNNLLASIEIPILMIGDDRRIRRFTPRAEAEFNLIPADVGRPIENIKSNFDVNLDLLISEVKRSKDSREIEVQDRQGSWRRLSIRPYKTNENKIDGSIVSVVDIDYLKQKEKASQDSFDYIASVAETVPFPLAVVGHDFILKSANNSFYKFFRTSKNIAGKVLFDAIKLQAKEQERFIELFSQTIDADVPFVDFEIELEVDGDLKVKNRFSVVLSGGKVHWRGNEPKAVLLSFIDITERRRVEVDRNRLHINEQLARSEAEKAGQAKDIFLATLSHELRTPLSAILTWSQLIRLGQLNPQKIQYGASVIEQNAKAQSQLIDDLLDISRVISGKLALEIDSINPMESIHTAIESVQPLADKKSIEIVTELSSESEVILADPVRLQQIVWNLLTNSIKFSPKDSRVEVHLSYVDIESKRFAQIKVIDHGKGIPVEFLPQLFNRFSQADGASTRVHGGLGLGLSIVRNLVELQGGKVMAENNRDGKGATFTATFPLTSAKAGIVQTEKIYGVTKQQDAKRITYKEQPRLDGLRILLVDDDESTREAIAIYLQSFGAEVSLCESAAEALKNLPNFKPNIIVSDIAMPGEDGYSLISKIRSLNSNQGGQVPAIALTAYAAAGDVLRAMQSGFQAHLAKPVEANALARKILTLLP